ncbi:MAG: hypothetical protein ACE5QV_08870, partial [Fidelibacterota bacterium]
IVGPNGCGKTNIVDAIRWVLGEQKASILRSDRMHDVIFNGTDGKKPLGMAEVSLTISESDKVLPLDYSEIEITRRIFRDGESEYFINKTPCRLKDILELFMDTGIGTDAYSVIELSMVDLLLSDNNEEKRRLFEEAAEITKYKFQRRSTFRKLDATRMDLIRITDIIGEVKKNVRSLKGQLRRYHRYQLIKDSLREKEIEYAQHKFSSLIYEIHPLEERLNHQKILKDSAVSQIHMDEALISELKKRIKTSETKIDELDNAIHEKQSEIQQIKDSILVMTERKKSLLANISKDRREIENLKKEIDNFKVQKKELSERLNELTPVVEEKEQKQHILKEKIAMVEKELTDTETALRRVDDERLKIARSISIKSGSLENLKDDISELNLQLNKRNTEYTRIEEKEINFSKQLREFTIQKDRILSELGNIEEQIERFEKDIKLLSDKLTENSQIMENVKFSIEQNSSKIGMLKGIITNYEGFPGGARYVLKNRSSVGGILGSISELFEFDAGIRKAALSVSRDYLQCVVVESRKDAFDILGLVKGKKLGYITIIPLEIIDKIDVKFFSAVSKVKGLKYLADFIKSDARFEKLKYVLYGGIALADSREKGLSLLGKGVVDGFVTPDGEYYEKSGKFSGGEGEAEEFDILNTRESIKKLE